ncbi:MAG: hypothetical protein QOJ02_1935 [Acidobacteriota bacterium]|nr:hypothetical protein [Acidobacteriota bacterium]
MASRISHGIRKREEKQLAYNQHEAILVVGSRIANRKTLTRQGINLGNKLVRCIILRP